MTKKAAKDTTLAKGFDIGGYAEAFRNEYFFLTDIARHRSNAILTEQGLPQSERLIRMRKPAVRQLSSPGALNIKLPQPQEQSGR